MILKGNQRGGGQQLAAHLMNSFDNERVELVEVRGAVAQDLSGAFAEWAAQARGTRCEKYIYSLSLDPDPKQGRLTREQYLDLMARTERSLKLVGQPRAVVFHEKRGEDGVLREHCHAVWSRIDTDRMKAVQIAHDRLKLRTVAREFARDHGLELPDGMKTGPNNKKFNSRAKQENLAERQQHERTGISKEELRTEITACWNHTSNGAAFVAALESKGYTLARGERHGKPSYVLVDFYSEIHSLSRYLDGITAKDMRARLRSSHPFESLPGVDDARAAAKKAIDQVRARIEDAHAVPQKSAVDEKRKALTDRQASRRSDLDRQRIDLYARQFAERGALRQMQADEHSDVASERRENRPSGLAAFLTRITGIGKFVAWAQDKADKKREAGHARQTQALLGRHGREVKEMDRHYRALDRLEKREIRAADTALLREGYRKLRVRSFELKPEFDRALAARVAPRSDTDAGSGQVRQKIAGLFSRIAGGVGFTKGDLQAAFERATSARTGQAGDTDNRGPSRPDPEKLDRARRLKEELERLQREQDRDDRGPDRGR